MYDRRWSTKLWKNFLDFHPRGVDFLLACWRRKFDSMTGPNAEEILALHDSVINTIQYMGQSSVDGERFWQLKEHIKRYEDGDLEAVSDFLSGIYADKLLRACRQLELLYKC